MNRYKLHLWLCEPKPRLLTVAMAAPGYGSPCLWGTRTGAGWGFRYQRIMCTEYTLDWLQSEIFLVNHSVYHNSRNASVIRCLPVPVSAKCTTVLNIYYVA